MEYLVRGIMVMFTNKLSLKWKQWSSLKLINPRSSTRSILGRYGRIGEEMARVLTDMFNSWLTTEEVGSGLIDQLRL